MKEIGLALIVMNLTKALNQINEFYKKGEFPVVEVKNKIFHSYSLPDHLFYRAVDCGYFEKIKRGQFKSVVAEFTEEDSLVIYNFSIVKSSGFAISKKKLPSIQGEEAVLFPVEEIPIITPVVEKTKKEVKKKGMTKEERSIYNKKYYKDNNQELLAKSKARRDAKATALNLYIKRKEESQIDISTLTQAIPNITNQKEFSFLWGLIKFNY